MNPRTFIRAAQFGQSRGSVSQILAMSSLQCAEVGWRSARRVRGAQGFRVLSGLSDLGDADVPGGIGSLTSEFLDLLEEIFAARRRTASASG